jgi:hypothetical protein
MALRRENSRYVRERIDYAQEPAESEAGAP